MNSENKSFLQRGVFLYTEARHTLAAFEKEIGKVLESALRARKRWGSLKDYHIDRPSAEGGSGDSYGWCVATFIRGHSPQYRKVVIDCGFWWKTPPPHIVKPIIYASYYRKPKQVERFAWPSIGKSGILSFEQWGRTYLYVPVPKSVEIEAPLNQLLDALLKRLNA